MIDLNTLISNALTAAVQQAVAPLNGRIAALESANDILHRVQGERIAALAERIATLENNPAQGVDTQAAPTTGLTREQVEAMIEQSMDHHLECYDHDNYDAIVSKVDDLPDPDDLVTNDNFEDAVREAVGNLSFDISVS